MIFASQLNHASRHLKSPVVYGSHGFPVGESDFDSRCKLAKFVRELYRTMVLVAQWLGLRISEVMSLQWGDFDSPI
jgi:integrase